MDEIGHKDGLILNEMPEFEKQPAPRAVFAGAGAQMERSRSAEACWYVDGAPRTGSAHKVTG
jgi:hypothetical protein